MRRWLEAVYRESRRDEWSSLEYLLRWLKVMHKLGLNRNQGD